MNSYDFEEIIDFNFDNTLTKLLLIGVGVYTDSLDSNYKDQIITMAQKKQLAYIITDHSLSYGVNLPISNIIILDDIGMQLSLNSLF